MKLVGTAIHEALCDWPGCQKPFNDTVGVNVALISNGEISAFCADHSARVASEGTTLRSLTEIRAEADVLEAWKRG